MDLHFLSTNNGPRYHERIRPSALKKHQTTSTRLRFSPSMITGRQKYLVPQFATTEASKVCQRASDAFLVEGSCSKTNLACPIKALCFGILSGSAVAPR